MHPLKEKIIKLAEEVTAALSSAKTLAAVEELRIHYSGRKGTIAACMEELKNLSLEDKRIIGPLINEIKKEIEERIEKKYHELKQASLQEEQQKEAAFDVTAYYPARSPYGLHPLTLILEQVTTIFSGMGFDVVDGLEVETEYYNFDALNIPADHPAREFWDTFWLDIPGLLLRTHTSPVQIHALEQKKLPLAVIAPGRCYRHEATDATHDFMFMQLEGLMIDKNLSMSNLLGVIQAFVRQLFTNKNLKIRVRPSYFPFVEPGIEIDVQCPFCTQGCSVCKQSTWIETCGAGMVHPTVLSIVSIDPREYTGFAFGFGLTRLALIQYAIPDIRLLYANNYEFLKQF